jgi:hypothetical protein
VLAWLGYWLAAYLAFNLLIETWGRIDVRQLIQAKGPARTTWAQLRFIAAMMATASVASVCVFTGALFLTDDYFAAWLIAAGLMSGVFIFAAVLDRRGVRLHTRLERFLCRRWIKQAKEEAIPRPPRFSWMPGQLAVRD